MSEFVDERPLLCMCVQFVKSFRCISTKIICFAARQKGLGCASLFHADTYVCMCSNRFLESFGGCLAMVKRARQGTLTVPAIGKRARGALCGLCLSASVSLSGEASTGPAALASDRDLESRILKFCRHSSDAHRLAVGVDDLELEGTVHLVTLLCAVFSVSGSRVAR